MIIILYLNLQNNKIYYCLNKIQKFFIKKIIIMISVKKNCLFITFENKKIYTKYFLL